MAEPEAELDRQRAVQAVFVADLVHDLLRGVGGDDGVDRVARRDVDQHEADQAHGERDGDRVEDAADQIHQHQAATRMQRAARSGAGERGAGISGRQAGST